MNPKRILAAIAATLLIATATEAQITIVPQPQVVRLRPGTVLLPQSPKLYISPKAGISKTYALGRLNDAGISAVVVQKPAQADIAINIGKGAGRKEGYRLTATAKPKAAIAVMADDRSGAIYAIESLRQMLRHGGGGLSVNECTITDWPEFRWRAFMLDEARHFHGKEMVKRLADEMVGLKMNIFHWHLVDNPGWRIEIKGYPKLTSVGSLGDYSHPFPGAEKWKEIYPDRERSYYTQDEIREIVAYCAERGISVMPEIEVPAHCGGATHAYPELLAQSADAGAPALFNVAAPEFWKFIETTLSQVVELFPSRLLHIGGDEAYFTRWQNNPDIARLMKEQGLQSLPDVQIYAINRIQKFLARRGVKLVGWNEITGDNILNQAGRGENVAAHLDPGAIVQFWNGSGDLAKKAIKKGFSIVNSFRYNAYLDYTYNIIPVDEAYNFNPYFEDLTPEENRKVIGLGCQMWGEYTPNTQRLYFQVFPRLAAYAECAWTNVDNKNYADFVRRMAPIEKTWLQKGYFTGQPSYTMGVPVYVKEWEYLYNQPAEVERHH